jgi:hypothetical protein
LSRTDKIRAVQRFLNAQDERFPGFPFYTQGSNRNSYAAAVRSTFGSNIVNEARYAVSTGLSEFSGGISRDDLLFKVVTH